MSAGASPSSRTTGEGLPVPPTLPPFPCERQEMRCGAYLAQESDVSALGASDDNKASEKAPPSSSTEKSSDKPASAAEARYDGHELLLLTHSHAHAQWRTIAEEFSSLLDKDFVDIVFKVAGGWYLAAHRALVAAVWPALRQELRTVRTLPSDELVMLGMAWVTSGGAAPSEPSSPPGDAAQPRTILSAETRTKTEGDTPASTNGVVDISNRPWGSWGIVRALLCHLYSRPVAIQRDNLTDLRSAATSLGCMELARSCDDAAEKNRHDQHGKNWSAWRTNSATSAPFSNNSNDALVGAGGGGSGEGGAGRRDSSEYNTSQSTQAEKNTPEKWIPGASGLMDGFVPEGQRLATQQDENWKKSGKEARARVVQKPKGESSFTQEGDNKRAKDDGLGIRHVLSDLKRSIVESSRVICDKSFHTQYDLVTDERGILGEGINGPVRMAKNKRNGREVAVKRITCVNLSEQRRQMLLSEVRIFLQVSHRNIVQLFEVYESNDDQAVLLVMELCTGKELFERLAERKFYSEFDSARITRQMLDAVSYLHAQNICHRDLKLENWLYADLSEDAKLKLCDFGFGQIVEPSVQMTATLGSLYYVAPEVLEGSYGLPCDMWSMGVIVYMLLVGNPPFDGPSDEEIIAKIRTGKLNPSSKKMDTISEAAKHFLYSVLRKDPYERLSASEAAQHAWLNMECTSKRLHHGGQPQESLLGQSVVRDMWSFAQNSAIARAALGMLATSSSSSAFHGTEEDVMSLELRFQQFDANNTGKINAEDFIKVLKESLKVGDSEAALVFERIAGNMPVLVGENQKSRKREINYAAFIQQTKAKRVANNSAAIRDAFRAFDKDGVGFITDGEIRGILGDQFKGDEEMVKATIEKCDLTGEGLIDYVNFAAVMAEELSKKESKVVTKSTSPESDSPADIGPNGTSQTAPPNRDSPTALLDSTPSSPKGSSSLPEPVVLPSEADESSASPTETKATKEGLSGSRSGSKRDRQDEEEEEDEHCAESDGEEQLVNVKDGQETGGPQAIADEAADKKKAPPPKKDRFHTFALSLAGSSEHDDHPGGAGVNRVASLPSDVYIIRQLPNFHKEILKPFYASRPVSNVCMGLIRGTSLYAKQSVAARLATIIHTVFGWYLIMPNPKYHKEVNDRKGLLSKETGKFRFVAWWIHPRFVPQMRRWFERMNYEGVEQTKQDKAKRAQEKIKADRAKQDAKDQEGADTAPEEVAMSDKEILEARVGNRVSDPNIFPGEPGPSFLPPSEDRPVSPEDRNLHAYNNGQQPGTAEEGRAVSNDKHSQCRVGPATIHATMSGTTTASGPPPVPPSLERGKTSHEDEKKFEKGKEYPMGVGNPGDFQFSDVPKPEQYLHSFRDLHTRDHITMLTQLEDGVHRFLRTLFDADFLESAHISAGFHYPVRTQYATLHMQVRVNSGSVCRDDGRGIDIHSLIENLQGDRLKYQRDDFTTRYQVTENIKVSLLAAANEYSEINPHMEVVRQTALLGFDLGVVTMPTIKDEDEDTEDAQVKSKNEEILHEYIINLQPSAGSAFATDLYNKRTQTAELFGKDPSYLYPLHVSVTGFFECNKPAVDTVAQAMREILSEELSEIREQSVEALDILSVNAGYVLQDLKAPAITCFAKSLGARCKDLGVNVRPKAVNHITLAMARPDSEVRRKIQDIYASDVDKLKAEATFDVVLSRRTFRGSFDRLDVDGPHQFKEVARICCSTAPRNNEAWDKPAAPKMEKAAAKTEAGYPEVSGGPTLQREPLPPPRSGGSGEAQAPLEKMEQIDEDKEVQQHDEVPVQKSKSSPVLGQ